MSVTPLAKDDTPTRPKRLRIARRSARAWLGFHRSGPCRLGAVRASVQCFGAVFATAVADRRRIGRVVRKWGPCLRSWRHAVAHFCGLRHCPGKRNAARALDRDVISSTCSGGYVHCRALSASENYTHSAPDYLARDRRALHAHDQFSRRHLSHRDQYRSRRQPV